jgi:chloramphenicol 3-O-phosphotransferase
VKVDDAFDGGRGQDGFHFVRDDAGHLHVEAGPVGRRLLRSYRRAVGACARAGNNVVVDECKFDVKGWDEWQDALAGLDATWVRVECDLDVCDQREAQREDRRELVGLARGQYERAHADAKYDIVVNLTNGDVEGATAVVLAAVEA